MRHANAEPHAAGGDRCRRLTQKGQERARIVAEALRERGWCPDHVVCSAHVRAMETLVHMIPAWLEPPPTQFEPALWGMSGQELVRLAESLLPPSGRVLVLAHNPGIWEATGAFGPLPARFPPACLFAVERADPSEPWTVQPSVSRDR